MSKYNKTTVFLYPLLGIPMNFFKSSSGKTRYLNSYLYDLDIADYKTHHVFVLIDNYQDAEFTEFEKKLRTLNNYVTDYDILGGRYSVKVFKIPDEFIGDYELFLKGKYSQFSQSAKDRVMIYELKNLDLLTHIFNKTEEARRTLEKALDVTLDKYAEVYGVYDENVEVLTFDNKHKLKHSKEITPDESFN